MKRITWKSENLNKPASEKQIAFVQDIVNRLKANAAASSQSHVREFWSRVEVPANLNAWEGSGIIDTLRNQEIAETALNLYTSRLLRRPEKIDSSMKWLGMTAFTEATKWLVNLINEKKGAK